MYADTVTGSMRRAIDETERRRGVQQAYNEAHGIIPKTIVKEINNTIEISKKVENVEAQSVDKSEILKQIERLTSSMKLAASGQDFELAIKYREQIASLKRMLDEDGYNGKRKQGR